MFTIQIVQERRLASGTRPTRRLVGSDGKPVVVKNESAALRYLFEHRISTPWGWRVKEVTE